MVLKKYHFFFKVLRRSCKKRSPETFIPINNLLDKVDNLWDVLADTREAVRREHVQGFHILIILYTEITVWYLKIKKDVQGNYLG
jgi:hypothetical protein